MIYDIDGLKRKVLHIYPYFGGLAAGITYEEAEGIRTAKSVAGADASRGSGFIGRTIVYDPHYLAELSVGQQIFVLARALCHIAFRHERRGQGKDPAVWKAATDAVITQMLKRDGLELPADVVDYPEAAGYDAEHYYEILLQHKLQVELPEASPDTKQDITEQQGEGEWAPGEDSTYPGESGAHQQDDDREDDDDGEELFRELAQQDDRPDTIREAETSGGKQKEQREDEEQSEQEPVLRPEEVSAAGNSIRRATREMDGIGTGGPIIDWRQLLRDTINYDVDWSFTHAILEDGIVRPVLEERPMPETEIVLDTSWSVDEELLRRFLWECKNILQYSRLRAGCFDTVFYGFRDIRTEEDIENMTFEGGGGTDFNVAVEAFTQRVDNRIIFTDGKAPLPEKPVDAVWVIYGDEKIEPKGGKVIHCVSP